MADVVSSIVLVNNPKRLVVKLMSRSDGTGESNVVKVDKSTYTGLNGLEPSYFRIERVQYNVSGMEVAVSVDATTDVVLFRLNGGAAAVSGEMCFYEEGGLTTSAVGDTGDILFSTNGHSAGDSYDITLHMRKID
jgi:hypothetical protein